MTTQSDSRNVMGRKTVWKYTWPLPHDKATFDMPRDAEILHVSAQGDDLCLWARIVEGRKIETKTFLLCGTGHEAPSLDCKHIGTALLHGGALVLHVFEDVAK
jgi:hypothetical protein